MVMGLGFLLTVLAATSPATVPGPQPTPATTGATAVLAQVPPRIDGKLDDSAWTAAVPQSDLIQIQPDEGRPVSERTEVRIVFDSTALYLGFRCFDRNPSQVDRRLARRDASQAVDVVWVDLDTRGDHQSAFHFEVTAANVQRDAIRTGDDAYDFAWDSVWVSAVSVDEQGWSAEVKIPFSQLRFEAGNERLFRMQLGRFIARKNEFTLWAFKPRNEFGEIQRFRALQGIHDVALERLFEARPYLSGALRHRTASQTEKGGTFFVPAVGIDIRWGLLPSLVFDLTALPDFGQVDADPALLNLSTFEIQFPERRPFFLESVDLYQLRDAFGQVTPGQLFYSRRIGASLPVGRGAARILGAAKLSGRIGDAISLGVLDAVTSEESVDGAKVVPLSNFAIARAFRNLGKHFTLGGTVTDVRRAENGVGFAKDGVCNNETGDASPTGRCTRDVTTGALDLRYSGFDGAINGAAQLIGSYISDGPIRTRRDGTVLKPNQAGMGARVELAKPSGLLFGYALFETFSPELMLDDVGFLQRPNLHRLFLRAGVRTSARGPIQQSLTGVEAYGRNGWEGTRLNRGINLNNYTQWSNFWESWLEFQWVPKSFENRELRDGTRFERPGYLGVNYWVGTNRSKLVSGEIFGQLSYTDRGGFDLDTGMGFTAQPIDRLQFTINPGFRRVTHDIRWVDTPSPGEYLLGEQEAIAGSLTLRSALVLSPRMSFQLYAQLFIADVQYQRMFQAMETVGGAVTLASLKESSKSSADYRGVDVALNINAVFRWEFWPGSTVFVVYSRAQGGSPEHLGEAGRPRLDLATLGRVVSEDVVMVKISYYFVK